MSKITHFVISFIFILIPISNTFSQPIDYFPLSVGNSWTYRYWNQYTEYYRTTTDTGTAKCYIYSKTFSNDSVFWSFLEVLDIVRLYSTSAGAPTDSAKAIIDTTIFSLIEVSKGDHVLKVVGNSRVLWLVENCSRYYPTALNDTVNIFKGNPYTYLHNYNILQRFIGPINIYYNFHVAHIATISQHKLIYYLPTSIQVSSGDHLQSHFFLNQNYPNPFNPATTISFSIPIKSFVSLKIFDALGREVSTLFNEELSAGNQTRQWNASNAASGVYFYQLKAGSFTETKKLLLLR